MTLLKSVIQIYLCLMFCLTALLTSPVAKGTPEAKPHCKPKNCIIPKSNEERSEYINLAETMLAPPGKDRSLLAGPKPDSIPFKISPNGERQIECTFIEPKTDDALNGKSPKFDCEIRDGSKNRKLRVKYQNPKLNDGNQSIEPNEGIWGETLATRLLWAMGFAADAVYPAKVICKNCPPMPWLYLQVRQNSADLEFNVSQCEFSKKENAEDATSGPETDAQCQLAAETLNPANRMILEIPDAVIEVKSDFRKIEQHDHQGWSWDEFDTVTEKIHSPNSLRAQRDALALVATFIQHADNKAEQQRLVCLDSKSEDTHCSQPLLMLQDVGMTFGAGVLKVVPEPGMARSEISKLHRAAKSQSTASLKGFRSAPIWSDNSQCITDLRYKPNTGAPANKKISEAGRKLFVQRMALLTEKDLTDLFTVANIERRSEKISDGGNERLVTVSDWVNAFQTKFNEIQNHVCPE